MDDRESRTGRSRHHVRHAGVTAQKTLFIDRPLMEMPRRGGHGQRRRRGVTVHEDRVRDADQRRRAVELGVLQHRRL